VAAVVASVASQGTLGEGAGGLFGDRDYSYFHSQTYNENSHSPQFKRDGVFANENEWTYDGPYEYGDYGSSGMEHRRSGRGDQRDPVTGIGLNARDQDVFSAHGLSSDLRAGERGGLPPWMEYLDQTYSPYEGLSNPYNNELATTFGEPAVRW
jgi:hypothetical protein